MKDPYRAPAERANEELQAWFYWSPWRWRRWQVVSFALTTLAGVILHAAGMTYRARVDYVQAEIQAAKHPATPPPCAEAMYDLKWHKKVVCEPNQKLTLTGGLATCVCKSPEP